MCKTAKLIKKLKETEELGTEATRASIIDLLFKRQFYAKGSVNETSSYPTGNALINAFNRVDTHTR